jgi:hypothetical protein
MEMIEAVRRRREVRQRIAAVGVRAMRRSA